MSTSRILLPITTAKLPTTNPAVRPADITSGVAGPANTPRVTYDQLQFNDTTDQHAMWTMRTPADYLSGGLIVVTLSAAAAAGNVVMSAGLAPIIHASTLMPSAVFNAADVSATTAVPGSIGMSLDLSWALTATSMAGSRRFTVFLGRRASFAADTAVGDVYVTAAAFEYTS